MELLVLGAVVFAALLAFAPESAIQVGLVAAWALGAISVVVAIVVALARLLF